MASALGGQFLDATGRPIADGGEALVTLVRIDLSAMHPGLARVQVTGACDVDNPLTGPSGASAVYDHESWFDAVRAAPGGVLLDFGFRSGATFGLQWAYDKGGLPKAVALHMWIDTAASLIDYLLESGTPSALAVSFSVKLKMAGWKSRAPLRDTLRTVSRCRRPGGASSRGGGPGSRYSQAVLMR